MAFVCTLCSIATLEGGQQTNAKIGILGEGVKSFIH